MNILLMISLIVGCLVGTVSGAYVGYQYTKLRQLEEKIKVFNETFGNFKYEVK